MRPLRLFAALSGLTQRIYFITGVGFIFLTLSLASAKADDQVIVSVLDASPIAIVATSPVDGATVTSAPALDQALETQTATSTSPVPYVPPTVDSLTATIQQAQETLTATTNAATEYQLSQNVVIIADAQSKIDSATAAVQLAVIAVSQVDSQTVIVAAAQGVLLSATDSLTAVSIQVANQELVVETATAKVVSDQVIVTTKENELAAAIALPPSAMTYTTPGYTAPVAPETPTVTTTVLPAMWDASTKIETPFDVKMGDTVFNGQGTASQIYVSSKAIISFGGPDFTYWDWPNATQDGIYVFQSDYMSAGPGASVTVTTTETTLSIDWILHRFGDSNGPLTNITWDMTVNPETGEWTGVGTMSGNTDVYGGPRTGVRQDNVLTQIPVLDNTQKTALISTATQNLTTAQQNLTNDQQNLTNQTQTLTTLQQNKVAAQDVVVEKQSILTYEESQLASLQETATATLITASSLVDSATAAVATVVASVSNTPTQDPTPVPTVVEPQPSPQPQPVTPVDPTPSAPEPDPTPSQEESTTPDTLPEDQGDGVSDGEPAPEDESTDTSPTDPDTEGQQTPTEDQVTEEDTSTVPEETQEPPVEETVVEEEAPQPLSEEQVQESLLEEAYAEDTPLEQKVEAILEAFDKGEAVPLEVLLKAGVELSDLPPETPVEVRQDENGNEVIITADVAAALVLLENPAELLGAIFSDPGEALQALGSIGADMSPEEREEAEKMVVAAVIAGQAALNAVGIAASATTTTTGGSTGGGGGSSGGGGASGESGYRRRKP